MSNQIFKYFAGVLGIIVITLVANNALIQGAPLVKLDTAPPLAGAISQSIGLSGASVTLPKAGEDYTIKSVRYFISGLWAVAVVEPAHGNSDSGVVILKKINGSYEVVLGPANSFSNSYRYTLPPEITLYLNDLGVFNG